MRAKVTEMQWAFGKERKVVIENVMVRSQSPDETSLWCLVGVLVSITSCILSFEVHRVKRGRAV
jgi:hypothetical protein